MSSSELDTLVNELKSFLNFTWTDSARTAKITSYALSSIEYLQEVAGITINFNNDHLARDLLFNRVLYMDSQKLSDFNENYNGLLEELKIKYGEITSIQ